MDPIELIRSLYDLMHNAKVNDDYLEIIAVLNNLVNWRNRNGFLPMSDSEFIKTIGQVLDKVLIGIDNNSPIGG